MRGGEGHPALGGLAETLPLDRRLDPVPDRILDQMQERIRQLLDDAVVDLGALASNRQRHRFPGGPSRLPHLLGHPGEESSDRHHARPGDLLAERRGQALDLSAVLADAAQERHVLDLDLAHVGRHLGHAPGQDVDVVIAVELQLGEKLGQIAEVADVVALRPRAFGGARRHSKRMAPELEVAPHLPEPGPAGEQ